MYTHTQNLIIHQMQAYNCSGTSLNLMLQWAPLTRTQPLWTMPFISQVFSGRTHNSQWGQWDQSGYHGCLPSGHQHRATIEVRHLDPSIKHNILAGKWLRVSQAGTVNQTSHRTASYHHTTSILQAYSVLLFLLIHGVNSLMLIYGEIRAQCLITEPSATHKTCLSEEQE